MNVLLLGSGGREHALAWKLSQSSLLQQLYIAPGNAGTATKGKNVDLDPMDFPAVERFVRREGVAIVVVGPEGPLVAGITDYLTNSTKVDVQVIGPGKAGAQIEGSKEFAKAFMARHQIPTARYGAFDASRIDDAKAFLDKFKPPYVLKADGLAAGKGVIITESREEAEKALDDMLIGRKFGEASDRVVIEEFLDGIELSMFVLTDGEAFHVLPSAKDYKRIGEGDTGQNTGGMGAISPVPFFTPEFREKVLNQVIIPTVKGLRRDGIPYCGFIFIGLIKVGGDPYVVEYNCRLGDPETEVILPRIKSDLLHLFDSMGSGLLSECDLEIDDRAVSTVILASGGYPASYPKGLEIRGLGDLSGIDGEVFHAGTKEARGKTVTNGGRVLAVSGFGKTLKDALANSYKLAGKLDFDGCYKRNDIGKDVLS